MSEVTDKGECSRREIESAALDIANGAEIFKETNEPRVKLGDTRSVTDQGMITSNARRGLKRKERAEKADEVRKRTASPELQTSIEQRQMVQEQFDVFFQMMQGQLDVFFQRMQEQVDVFFQLLQKQLDTFFQMMQERLEVFFQMMQERQTKELQILMATGVDQTFIINTQELLDSFLAKLASFPCKTVDLILVYLQKIQGQINMVDQRMEKLTLCNQKFQEQGYVHNQKISEQLATFNVKKQELQEMFMQKAEKQVDIHCQKLLQLNAMFMQNVGINV